MKAFFNNDIKLANDIIETVEMSEKEEKQLAKK